MQTKPMMMACFLMLLIGGLMGYARAEVVYQENFNDPAKWPYFGKDEPWTYYNPDYSEKWEWQVLESMTCEGTGAIAHSWTAHDADTWVASPAFWLSSVGNYNCSFQQRVGNAGYPEKMSTYIWKGNPSGFNPNDPNAKEIWKSDDVGNTTCITHSVNFDVSSIGTGSDYHVIFYCTSLANEYLAIWDTLQVTGTPTLVQLVNFTADPCGSGECLRIQWETASETDNAGFHIWRSDTKDGPYGRITQILIPAKGGVTSGASYTYDDMDVTPPRVRYYKLEDINNSGFGTFHGPIPGIVGDATIPTLSQWGMILLSLILGTAGVLVLRRRRLGLGSMDL